MDDGTVFLPNDRYPLERFSFRLYYTSRSDDQQTIDVYGRVINILCFLPPRSSKAISRFSCSVIRFSN